MSLVYNTIPRDCFHCLDAIVCPLDTGTRQYQLQRFFVVLVYIVETPYRLEVLGELIGVKSVTSLYQPVFFVHPSTIAQAI